MTIRLVIDSASDIPWDFADKHKIKVVPLSVSYYDQSFKEDRNFDLEKHYRYYETDKDFLPKTSQPSPREYLKVYEGLDKEGATEIIVVCISSALSGTMNSARLAANMFSEMNKEVKIHLVDSLNASYTEVFLIEEALKQIKKGLKAEEIVEILNKLVKNIKTFILIPTLRYLHLGGRINIAKYLLAKLLKKMAITRVNEKGTNETAATVTSIKEGLELLVKLTTENNTRFPRKVAIVHANNLEHANVLKQLVDENIPKADCVIIQTKCTISAHTGPNAVALLSDFGIE
ncbi:MAG: DegV family protein [Asgard group archaeon]|nr:DegV family protein [Asgard group archaeon]